MFIMCDLRVSYFISNIKLMKYVIVLLIHRSFLNFFQCKRRKTTQKYMVENAYTSGELSFTCSLSTGTLIFTLNEQSHPLLHTKETKKREKKLSLSSSHLLSLYKVSCRTSCLHYLCLCELIIFIYISWRRVNKC